jgi:hypothetical protein
MIKTSMQLPQFRFDKIAEIEIKELIDVDLHEIFS